MNRSLPKKGQGPEGDRPPMTSPPRKPAPKQPLPVPMGVAVLGVLFAVGVVLVLLPKLASGGWGGVWRVVQVVGLVAAGVLVFRWFLSKTGSGQGDGEP